MLSISESVNLRIEGLNEVYVKACECKDYVTCEVIRLELARILTGKKLLIPTGRNFGPGSDLTTILLS